MAAASPMVQVVTPPSLRARVRSNANGRYEPAKVTVTRWKPSEVSMLSSIPVVFFCASASSGLCLAAAWIFCWARI